MSKFKCGGHKWTFEAQVWQGDGAQQVHQYGCKFKVSVAQQIMNTQLSFLKRFMPEKEEAIGCEFGDKHETT